MDDTEPLEGQTRRWVGMYAYGRERQHKVLRATADEVLIRYANKTTAWEPLDLYLANTEEVFVTKSGKVLTHDDIQQLADEAEKGYDLGG